MSSAQRGNNYKNYGLASDNLNAITITGQIN
jgi:hypothetical protein